RRRLACEFARRHAPEAKRGEGSCLALNYPRTPGFERVSCRAPAFGLRQLAGAFARGTVESGAAWLALVEKSGDKSPQSKRCRACETACRTPVPRVRCAPNAYHSGGYGCVPFNVQGLDRDFVFSLIGRWMLGVGCWMFKLHRRP